MQDIYAENVSKTDSIRTMALLRNTAGRAGEGAAFISSQLAFGRWAKDLKNCTVIPISLAVVRPHTNKFT